MVSDNYIKYLDYVEYLYKQAEQHLNTYTPSNAEQNYKHNNYIVLKEVRDILKELVSKSTDLKTTLETVYSLLYNKYKQALNNKSKKDYGIVETYYNLLRELTFYNIYIYDSEKVMLR